MHNSKCEGLSARFWDDDVVKMDISVACWCMLNSLLQLVLVITGVFEWNGVYFIQLLLLQLLGQSPHNIIDQPLTETVRWSKTIMRCSAGGTVVFVHREVLFGATPMK